MTFQKTNNSTSKRTESIAKNLSVKRLEQLLGAASLSFLLLSIPGFTQIGASESKHLEAVEVTPTPTITTTPIVAVKPTKKTLASPIPEITGTSVLVVDTATGTRLYEKNADLRLAPASTTKIMTALVALEAFQLDDQIRISREEATLGQTMELVTGEVITVENLLYGLLISSANDAALALALSYPHGGYQGFIERMNSKGKEMGLVDTHFADVSGLDLANHYTTASDMATIALHAQRSDLFRQIVKTQKKLITDVDGVHKHMLYTTNELLGQVDGVTGIKTGWTGLAGECLVTSVERNGSSVVIVLLNSQQRFVDTQKLITWVFDAYTWDNRSRDEVMD